MGTVRRRYCRLCLSHPDSLLYSGWLIFVIAVKICQEICCRINGASRRILPFCIKCCCGCHGLIKIIENNIITFHIIDIPALEGPVNLTRSKFRTFRFLSLADDLLVDVRHEGVLSIPETHRIVIDRNLTIVTCHLDILIRVLQSLPIVHINIVGSVLHTHAVLKCTCALLLEVIAVLGFRPYFSVLLRRNLHGGQKRYCCIGRLRSLNIRRSRRLCRNARLRCRRCLHRVWCIERLLCLNIRCRRCFNRLRCLNVRCRRCCAVRLTGRRSRRCPRLYRCSRTLDRC